MLAMKVQAPPLLDFVHISPYADPLLRSLSVGPFLISYGVVELIGDSSLGFVGHEWEEDWHYLHHGLPAGVLNEAYVKMSVWSVRIREIHSSGFRTVCLTPCLDSGGSHGQGRVLINL